MTSSVEVYALPTELELVTSLVETAAEPETLMMLGPMVDEAELAVV